MVHSVKPRVPTGHNCTTDSQNVFSLYRDTAFELLFSDLSFDPLVLHCEMH